MFAEDLPGVRVDGREGVGALVGIRSDHDHPARPSIDGFGERDRRDVQDIIRMCRRRIRVPEQWYGDYLATLGAARIAERRLIELCDQYGRWVVKAFIREWFDYSERRMADAISQLPAGQLVGSALHDPYPGAPEGIPLQVKVTIDPAQGMIELDLRDNPDNYPGGLNESRACATNNVMTGVFNSIDPDVPHNAGSFRRVKVLLREGCLAGIPEFPHSCSMATTNIADRLVCLTQAAFAELGDGFGLAEGALGMGISYAVISGATPGSTAPRTSTRSSSARRAVRAVRWPTAGRRMTCRSPHH